MNPIQKNITHSLEIENLPPDEQQEIILRVGALIYQNVLMRVMEILTDEEQDEFEKILDAEGKPEEIFGFLKSKVPSFENIIDAEAIKFKDKASKIMSQIEN